MLVLTRRTGEEIVIAGNIRVAVLSLNGRKVRLGITAPPSVGVSRQELLAHSIEFRAAPGSESDRQQACVTAKEQT